MKKLRFLIFLSSIAFAESPTPELRALYLKAMQEPTGKYFQHFQKACKQASSEDLHFSGDSELIQTLQPKKRHLGSQVHLLVIGYKYCSDELSKTILEETFAKESLDKNLKKFISTSCKEQLSEEDLKKVLSKPISNPERLKKRLKTVTIPGKCGEYKLMFERLVNSSTF